jgi:hypothetical protein
MKTLIQPLSAYETERANPFLILLMAFYHIASQVSLATSPDGSTPDVVVPSLRAVMVFYCPGHYVFFYEDDTLRDPTIGF